MRLPNLTPSQESLEWFYLEGASQSTKGPISERDIDVMWRTSAFDSHTLLWKEGMESWKSLNDLQDLKEKLMGLFFSFPLIESLFAESTKEMLVISQKSEKPATPKKPPKQKDLGEINLEREVEKLIANSAYQNPSDGLWYVYDHERKEWRTQDEDPNAGTADKGAGLLDRSKKISKPSEKPPALTEEDIVNLPF